MDVGWLDDWMVGWLDVGWMVGESGIKANSAQLSWSLAELGNIRKQAGAGVVPSSGLAWS